MQLLRDNLTLWTSDMQGDGEGENKAEGSILVPFLFLTIPFVTDGSKEKVEDVENAGES